MQISFVRAPWHAFRLRRTNVILIVLRHCVGLRVTTDVETLGDYSRCRNPEYRCTRAFPSVRLTRSHAVRGKKGVSRTKSFAAKQTTDPPCRSAVTPVRNRGSRTSAQDSRYNPRDCTGGFNRSDDREHQDSRRDPLITPTQGSIDPLIENQDSRRNPLVTPTQGSIGPMTKNQDSRRDPMITPTQGSIDPLIKSQDSRRDPLITPTHNLIL